VADIATILRDFLLQDGIQAEEKITLLQALTLYETKNIDFADALIAARMQERGIERVFSFDAHFDRVPGIQRVVPGALLPSSG
jgi:predicted nucleic acid-binding protein